MHFNLMDPKLIAGVVVIVLIIVVGVALYVRRQRTITAGLRGRFGSEYDRAVLEQGSEHKAEAKLVDRETRVENLKIRDLGPTERGCFLAVGFRCASRFVDHPKTDSDGSRRTASPLRPPLYPVTDFDQRAADISVNHPRLVEYYRSAHGVAQSSLAGKKRARKSCEPR